MRAAPESIKSEIITKYLEGLSTLEIQRLLNVSIGTLSAVTAGAARKDNSGSYMRDIARKFYKKNLVLDDVISGVRLYNKIKEVGLTCSFFESFLDSTNKESYRLEIENDKFLTKIIGILQFERQSQINLQDIADYIKKGKEEIDKMNDEFSRNYQSLYSKYSVKEEEIREYLKEKPRLIRSDELARISLPPHADWLIISDLPFKRASRKSGIKIDPNILYKKLSYIYKNPGKHVDIIKQILEFPRD